MKPLIVGELNPFDGDPRYALFPYALSSSGSRLCAILGLCERDYLRRFDRANLCVGTWDTAAARVVARRILKQRRRVLVLLGEKVATAFFGEFEPFSVGHLLGYAHRHATASERAQPYVERGERCQQSAAGSAHRGRAVTLDILCPFVETARLIPTNNDWYPNYAAGSPTADKLFRDIETYTYIGHQSICSVARSVRLTKSG